MTITFDRKETIGGFRFFEYRDTLRSLIRNNRSDNIIALALKNSRQRGAREVWDAAIDKIAICDDIMARGIAVLKDNSINSTPLGRGILNSTTRQPITAAQAHEIVRGVAKRAADLNARLKHGAIREIWLFGSTVHGNETVNDIDMTYRASHHPGRLQPFQQEVVALLEEAGRQVESPLATYQSNVDRLVRHVLRECRQSRISWTSDYILQSLNTPCKMVFDQTRGGPVNDAALPHHPDPIALSEDERPPRAQKPDTSVDLSFRPAHMMPALSAIQCTAFRWAAWQLGLITRQSALMHESFRADVLEWTTPTKPQVDHRQTSLVHLRSGSSSQTFEIKRDLVENDATVRLETEVSARSEPAILMPDELGVLLDLVDHELLRRRERLRTLLEPHRGPERSIERHLSLNLGYLTEDNDE